MSTLFSQLVGEVTGIIPGYSQFLAGRDMQKSWRDVCDRRTWSFLIGEGGFNAPALIQAGTVSVIQNSNLVVADAVAGPALNAVATSTPPLTQYQFRLSAAGAIYNITGWNNGTLTLTLDRPILETTQVGASYMAYECYFPPPPQALQSDGTYDFNRWISVVDPINGYVLDQDKGKAWLDLRDPQRSDFDLAYYIFDYRNSVNSQSGAPDIPMYEFWPGPTNGQEFVCLYKKRGAAFASGQSPLPQMIPDSLIIDRCLYKYAYRWAAVNAGRDPGLQKTNWLAMIRDAREAWEKELQVAKLEDDNVYMQSIIGPLRTRWSFGPIDSAFLQSHDAIAIW